MPRQPRFFIEDHPLHVIQRGNDRQAMFAEERDYRFFLYCLETARREHGVAVHAYALMTNHVHLLVTPQAATSVPRAMQAIGRRYVPWYNETHSRTGTLWEGRYRASLIDTDVYLLTCMRYIELNPVRAGLVTRPGDYAYSSFAANAFGARDRLITRHATYLCLGRSDAACEAAYRSLFEVEVPAEQIEAIRNATQNNWTAGSEAFRRAVGMRSRRRVAPVQRGRPKRVPTLLP